MFGIAIGITIVALVLYGVSGIVRRSGSAHILTIDYANIADPVALHHWAAGRLRGLAVAALVFGVAALTAPAYAMSIMFTSFIAVIAVAVSIVIGADRFRRA